MTNTLTWLHLSDLHMRGEAVDDISIVLRALWRDLPKQIERVGGGLDFIAFSGDVAYAGKAEEYELAVKYFFEPLLEVTEVAREQLFIVPGNHDVDRDLVALINPEIAQSLTDRERVREVLEDERRRQALFQPLSAYEQFIGNFFGGAPEHAILETLLYSCVQQVRAEAPSVALVGLNSTWLSGFNKDAGGKVDDRGKLLVGEKQVIDAYQEVERAEVKIALMHHPTSWLKEFDERDIDRWLGSKFDFVLRGHLHKPNFIIQEALGVDLINIPAGSVYKNREWLNGYNLVKIDFENRVGRIILRRYSAQRLEWVKDVQSTGDKLDGEKEFKLRGALGQPAPIRETAAISVEGAVGRPGVAQSAASQVLAEISPAWFRLGRDGEVQRLVGFFQQEGKATLWVWGGAGCGLNEFLQIVRALLNKEEIELIWFDGEEEAFGTPLDPHYLLGRLEQWVGGSGVDGSGRGSVNVEKWVDNFITQANAKLGQTEGRLALVFANFHLFPRALRDWVQETLWPRVREELSVHNPLGIFTCEGADADRMASNQENKIYLAEFTRRDVERFLEGLPFSLHGEVAEIARSVHSGGDEKYLAAPQEVYGRLIEQANAGGWLDGLFK